MILFRYTLYSLDGIGFCQRTDRHVDLLFHIDQGHFSYIIMDTLNPNRHPIVVYIDYTIRLHNFFCSFAIHFITLLLHNTMRLQQYQYNPIRLLLCAVTLACECPGRVCTSGFLREELLARLVPEGRNCWNA